MTRAKKKQATPFDPIVLPTLMDSRAAAESVLEQPFEQVAVASLIVPEFMSELLPVIDDQPGVALKPEFSDKASGAELTVVQQQTVGPEGVVKTETTETHEVVEDGKVVEVQKVHEDAGQESKEVEVVGDVAVSKFMMKGRRSYMEDFLGDDLASQNYKQVYERLLSGNPTKKIENMIRHNSVRSSIDNMVRNLLGEEVMAVGWFDKLRKGYVPPDSSRPRRSQRGNDQDDSDDSDDEYMEATHTPVVPAVHGVPAAPVAPAAPVVPAVHGVPAAPDPSSSEEEDSEEEDPNEKKGGKKAEGDEKEEEEEVEEEGDEEDEEEEEVEEDEAAAEGVEEEKEEVLEVEEEKEEE